MAIYATLWYNIQHILSMRKEAPMNNQALQASRQQLGKTQKQLSELLGTSLKAIQSFEQGWRNIPVHIERQVLSLLALKKLRHNNSRPCFVVRKCPIETKRSCPAWEFRLGHFCWFVNGTICHGQVQDSWQRKMEICRQCKVFRTILPI